MRNQMYSMTTLLLVLITHILASTVGQNSREGCPSALKLQQCNAVAVRKTETYFAPLFRGIKSTILRRSISNNCLNQFCCLYFTIKCTLLEKLRPHYTHCHSEEQRTQMQKKLEKLQKLRGCLPRHFQKLVQIAEGSLNV
ncbi:hypothetical protein EG68_10612 [Paragonimus skrjabini miyazakii]|uniref:Uncharacterized protein n=1 Tax=Paragonimus skrjabini miyazakii TaxID=59628 RepID=A0A8S9YFL9_9TREM|nr:hypothetical protein EG68_10612 [Paragonimus skrjabini miyazakii]